MPTLTPAPSPREPIDQALAQAYATQLQWLGAASLVGACLLTLRLLSAAPVPALPAWFAAALTVALLMGTLGWQLKSRMEAPGSRQRLLHLSSLLLLLLGVVWGSAPFIGLHHGSVHDLALCLILLMGLGAFGLYALCLHLPALYAFMPAALLPIAIRMGLGGSEWERMFGALSLTLLALALVYGQHLSNTLVQGITAQVQSQVQSLQLERQTGELRTALRALQRLSTRDPLTQCHNRRALMEHLERESTAQDRSQRPLALLRVDIDQFRQINKAHGHLTGDAVLKALAERLQSMLRGSDFLARYAGEEFVCVVGADSVDKLQQTAERLRNGVAARPLLDAPPGLCITVSVGGTLRNPYEAVGRVFERSGQALSTAQGQGPGQVVVLAPEVYGQVLALRA